MKNLWYNGNYKKYDEDMQQVICIGALMMLTNKEDFKRCLLKIKANDEARESVEKIVNHMNDEVEFITRYYDKEEEEKKIMDLEIALTRKEGFQEGIEQERLSIIQNMIEQNMEISEIAKIVKITEEEIHTLLKN